jgi:rhamnogalacturonyl hydrolase YesR
VWWATVDKYFNQQDGLFLRDDSFRDLREPNGRRIYWSRDNGLYVAALCRILDRMPANDPDRARYVALYQRMMAAILSTQQSDGLWRPGLLDPDTHAMRETGGSAFFVYALAWGANHNLLERRTVSPVIRRAWDALAMSVQHDGRLAYAQPFDNRLRSSYTGCSSPDATGALLLAGSEVYKFSQGAQAPAPVDASHP